MPTSVGIYGGAWVLPRHALHAIYYCRDAGLAPPFFVPSLYSPNSQSQSLLYDEPYPHTLFNINHTLTSTTTKTQLAIYLHLPPYALLPPFEFPPSVQLCRRSRSSPIMKRRPNASEFSLLFPGNFIPFSILSFIILKTTL